MRVPVFHKNTCHDFSVDIITHPPGIDSPPPPPPLPPPPPPPIAHKTVFFWGNSKLRGDQELNVI